MHHSLILHRMALGEHTVATVMYLAFTMRALVPALRLLIEGELEYHI